MVVYLIIGKGHGYYTWINSNNYPFDIRFSSESYMLFLDTKDFL